ncbi:MAG: molybdopterin-dependent oxidoreductase [Candidatus Binatia bacterium]
MTGLRIEGRVERPGELGFGELARLPGQIPDVGALAPGRRGGAVRFRELLEAVGAAADAKEVTLSSTDGGFVQSAPLSALGEAVHVYRLGDGPLPEGEGGPVRFLVPNLEECLSEGVDRCTNVKRLGTIRVG